MKIQKKLALAMALVMVALLAVGCGASNTGSTQGTKAPATEPSTEPIVITEPSTTPETSETVVSDELAKTFADFVMDVPDTLGYAVVDQNAVTEIGDVSGSHSALALDENNNLIVYGGQMVDEWAYAVSYIDGDFTVKELYNRPYPEDGPTEYDNTLDLTSHQN